MIRKSVKRFSEKIMLKADDATRSSSALSETAPGMIHDAIMPLFCPTRQVNFVKSEMPFRPGPWHRCMGLFSMF
jgi:hypothetical protein